MSICLGLARAVMDFKDWFQLAVENDNGYPGNAGMWKAVWPGVRAAQKHFAGGQASVIMSWISGNSTWSA